MEQRHRYEYGIDINGPTAAATVVRMVGKSKKVLELGAGPGSITKLLSGEGGCCVTAIELDETAIQKLTPFCERVFQCDLNDHTWTSVFSKGERFEVVVAADVFEHLYDPWKTLRVIHDVLQENGHVVVSLPHIGHNAVMACLLQGDLEYQDWGLLDKSHIRFFGIENMQTFFNNSGFKIVDAEFIVIPPEQTELARRWRRTPQEIKQALILNRFGTVYQVIIKAQSDSSPKKGIKLSSLPVGPSKYVPETLKGRFIRVIRERILPHLSPYVRMKLRNFLHKLGLKF